MTSAIFKLSILSAKDLALADNAEEWLKALPGPVVIELEGTDKTAPWKAISVLVHGNEPSGFFAVYRYLKERHIPRSSVALIISSVRAARHAPLFSHRMLTGEYDLNRRFGMSQPQDVVSSLAAEIEQYLRSKPFEYVVDLHNTSGNGPAFSVATHKSTQVQKLASYFCESQVVTQLIVGSLMEQNFNCPVVTIECGGSKQTEAHKLAYSGLINLLQSDNWQERQASVSLFEHPTRLCVKRGCSLEYANQLDPDCELTLIENIEQLNYSGLLKDQVVGWLNTPISQTLTAISEDGKEHVNDYFYQQGTELRAKQNLKVFMATPRKDIALADCLFYVL